MKLANVASLGSAIDKLVHDLNERAAKVRNRIEATQARGAVVFDQVHGALDNADAALDEVNAYLTTISESVGDNGGPAG